MLIAVIQARMGSQRLPGKVLAPVADRPMLVHQLERVARADTDGVVVATSEDPDDDRIVEIVEHAGYGCFRGSLHDVLDRLYKAARVFGAEHVIRLTADCPLIDHRVIAEVVARHLDDSNDYTSNTLRRTYPDGEDVEVVAFGALERAWREATDPGQREHVTPYIYEHPRRFRLGCVVSEQDLSAYRWTVDHPEDLRVVRTIFEALYAERPDFSMRDVLQLYERIPQLWELNAAVNPMRHFEKSADPAVINPGQG